MDHTCKTEITHTLVFSLEEVEAAVAQYDELRLKWVLPGRPEVRFSFLYGER